MVVWKCRLLRPVISFQVKMDLNSAPLGKNGGKIAGDKFKWNFNNENKFTQISFSSVTWGVIDENSPLVYIMIGTEQAPSHYRNIMTQISDAWHGRRWVKVRHRYCYCWEESEGHYQLLALKHIFNRIKELITTPERFSYPAACGNIKAAACGDNTDKPITFQPAGIRPQDKRAITRHPIVETSHSYCWRICEVCEENHRALFKPGGGRWYSKPLLAGWLSFFCV